MKRRLRDHPAWTWATVAGLVGMAATFWLKSSGKLAGGEFYAALAFAALMIRPDKLVDALRAWRRGDPSAGGGV